MKKQLPKRLLSILLALALTISLFPFAVEQASAESSELPAIAVSSKDAIAGGTVSVAVSLTNNPGITSMRLNVSYDDTLFTLKNVEYNSAMGGQYVLPESYDSAKSPLLLYWTDGFSDYAGNGTFATLTFSVSEMAAVGTTSKIVVTYDAEDVYNTEEKNVTFSVEDGTIRIINCVAGDINGDGTCNAKDTTRLMRYLANYDVEVNEKALDITGDGTCNAKDTTRLMRYLANWDVDVYFDGVLVEKCAHTLVEHPYKAATCTEDGNNAYWQCTACGKYYNSAAATTELTLAQTILKATGHTEVEIPAEEGWSAGVQCSVCGFWTTPREEVDPDMFTVKYDLSGREQDSYIKDYLAKLSEDEKAAIYPKTTEFNTTFKSYALEGLDAGVIPGYMFQGWVDAVGNSVTTIEKGKTGSATLYAKWEKNVYKVYFDTPDVDVYGTKINGVDTMLNGMEFTVDMGATLPNPDKNNQVFGYTFVGWSNEEGFIMSSIPKGTAKDVRLHANWTSDRNKATSYTSYGDPIIITDNAKGENGENRGQILFVYNIGRIDNVPLNVVEEYTNTEGIVIENEFEYVEMNATEYVSKINDMISEATTTSSGWTLSKDWNETYGKETGEEATKGKSQERTNEKGEVVGGKYFVSNSDSGSTHVSSESGGSTSNSSKVTMEDSVGLSGHYSENHDNYESNTQTTKGDFSAEANLSVPISVAKLDVGVKYSHSTEEVDVNEKRDTSALDINSESSSYVGTVDYNETNQYYNTFVSNDSAWNTTEGYEKSNELSTNEKLTTAINEALKETTKHNITKALSEGTIESNAEETEQTSKKEYTTGLTYDSTKSNTTRQSVKTSASANGDYRLISAGTVHVYGVVGYDVKTDSYFTYCYNVLDDATKLWLDFSVDGSFKECQNGVVTFEVPYEVAEYVAGFVGRTEGLEFDKNGQLNKFTAPANFDGTVVVPQIARTGDGDKTETYEVVTVSSLADGIFAGNTKIETVILPQTVKKIPDNAFAGCTNLKSVVGYGVTEIGARAFDGCTSLEKFSVDTAITALGDKAFNNVPAVEICASKADVAKAAINCGAKSIKLNIAYITDSFDGTDIVVTSDTDYFELHGNAKTVYKDVTIDSAAGKNVSDSKKDCGTYINNMNFADNEGTPLKLGSPKVTLASVSVTDSPSFAMILQSANTELRLLNEVKLDSRSGNTVLSQAVTLSMADSGTTSFLTLDEGTGKLLTCGAVTNAGYLKGVVEEISEDQYGNMLKAYFVTLDPQNGTLGENENKLLVYCGQLYGVLPTPVRKSYTFNGWFTEAEGGMQVTADSEVTATEAHTLYAQWTLSEFTVNFDANGGSVSEASRTVSCGAKFGTLPVPTRTGYTFGGWFTSDGTEITAEASQDEAVDVTLKAKWTVNQYNATWKTATGVTITVKRTSSPNAGAELKTLASGDEIFYGDVLEITYTRADYYTITKKGKQAITVTKDVTASDIYATAELNPLSDWVKASSVPSGAKVVNQKWTYTKTTNKESKETSLSGYKQVGSYWVQSGSGSANYASFPSGFDTGHSIYTSFRKSPYSSSETTTTKREVSNSWAGYVYWHWMYNTGSSTGYLNRAIYFKQASAPGAAAVGTTCANFTYNYFQAFTSGTAYPAEYSNWNQGHGEYLWYNCTGVNARSSYFYRLDYYTSTYTDYYKMFQYQKVENLESTTKVGASSTISNVQEWVQYRAK